MKKVIQKLILPTFLLLAMPHESIAATPTGAYHLGESKSTYYNDGTNSTYKDYWTNAVSLFNATKSVSLSTGTVNNIRLGNKNVSDVTWDGITEATYSTSTGAATSIRGWLNTYFTTQAHYTTSIIKGIATHEVGHITGLAHTSSLPSVMYPSSFTNNGTNTPARNYTWPTTDDKETLKKLYGTPYSLNSSASNVTNNTYSQDGLINIDDEKQLHSLLENYDTVVLSDPSWAVSYNDLSSLALDSDLVIEGTVVKGNNLIKDNTQNDDTYRTYSKIQITDILKGDSKLDTSTINIQQLGGSDDTKIVVSEGTTLLEENNTIIIFLKKVSSNMYIPINEDESIFLNSSSSFNRNNLATYNNLANNDSYTKEDIKNLINN